MNEITKHIIKSMDDCPEKWFALSKGFDELRDRYVYSHDGREIDRHGTYVAHLVIEMPRHGRWIAYVSGSRYEFGMFEKISISRAVSRLNKQKIVAKLLETTMGGK